MANVKNVLHNQLAGQESLFDNFPEGSLDVSLSFRSSLSKALSKSKDSRHLLAARISETSNRSLSKDLLDKACSHDVNYALRAEHIPAAIAVTRDFSFVQVLLDPFRYLIVGEEEGKWLKLGRLKKERSRIDGEIARMESELGVKER